MHLWSNQIFKTKAKNQKQTREKQMGMVCFKLIVLYIYILTPFEHILLSVHSQLIPILSSCTTSDEAENEE